MPRPAYAPSPADPDKGNSWDSQRRKVIKYKGRKGSNYAHYSGFTVRVIVRYLPDREHVAKLRKVFATVLARG
jgi:hypothetical protein